MDDQGSTSSWYVLSAMGFYPVDPSMPFYVIGSPIFERVKMRLGNGRTLEVVATNNSATNRYIQSATLNGRPWTKPWFSHDDIKNGAVLAFVMGRTPTANGEARPTPRRHRCPQKPEAMMGIPMPRFAAAMLLAFATTGGAQAQTAQNGVKDGTYTA